MAIVAGFDVHRAQITFDALDQQTGEVSRGRIPARPEAVRAWAGRFAGAELHVAFAACTGWLFVCEALVEAGAVAHLAEPVETSALRGKKRRAKTDREDARWLRTLLCEGRLPEAWIPPAHVREWRTRARLSQDAGRRAHDLAAASPSNALSPRRLGRAGQAAERPGPRVPRRP
jgi:transposase